jgi:hypothetical protein
MCINTGSTCLASSSSTAPSSTQMERGTKSKQIASPPWNCLTLVWSPDQCVWWVTYGHGACTKVLRGVGCSESLAIQQQRSSSIGSHRWEDPDTSLLKPWRRYEKIHWVPLMVHVDSLNGIGDWCDLDSSSVLFFVETPPSTVAGGCHRFVIGKSPRYVLQGSPIHVSLLKIRNRASVRRVGVRRRGALPRTSASPCPWAKGAGWPHDRRI